MEFLFKYSYRKWRWKEEEIDSRTSDAIALAIRFDAPIYALETVMEKAGIYLEVKSRRKNHRRSHQGNRKEIIQQDKGLDLSKKTKKS